MGETQFFSFVFCKGLDLHESIALQGLDSGVRAEPTRAGAAASLQIRYHDRPRPGQRGGPSSTWVTLMAARPRCWAGFDSERIRSD